MPLLVMFSMKAIEENDSTFIIEESENNEIYITTTTTNPLKIQITEQDLIAAYSLIGYQNFIESMTKIVIHLNDERIPMTEKMKDAEKKGITPKMILAGKIIKEGIDKKMEEMLHQFLQNKKKILEKEMKEMLHQLQNNTENTEISNITQTIDNPDTKSLKEQLDDTHKHNNDQANEVMNKNEDDTDID